MRFEYLCLHKTFFSLHDQQPVWLPPVVLFSTNCAPPLCGLSPRDPPNVVFQRETVAVWTQERHCDSSLSSNCDDTPQIVRASEHDLLRNAHFFSLVLCYQFERLFLSCRRPILRLSSFLQKVSLYSSHVSFLKAVKPFFTIGSLQSVSWQHFSCSKYFLADDSCCH